MGGGVSQGRAIAMLMMMGQRKLGGRERQLHRRERVAWLTMTGMVLSMKIMSKW